MSTTSHFFAQIFRMNFISRWSLMRNINSENIAEHSLQVAMVAHFLATIANKKFNGQYDPNEIAVLALFHDASEVFTGDLPTPIKYYNPNIAREYKKIELEAEKRLLNSLPDELQDIYAPLVVSNQIDKKNYIIVKQADNLCAYIKCLEEIKAGNKEFIPAKERLEKILQQETSPALNYFLTVFIPSFKLTFDEQN